MRRDRPVQGEARGGGLQTYVKKSLPYKVCRRLNNEEGALERLSIQIPISNQQTVTISNWYLPQENSHFLQRFGISMSVFQPEIQKNEIICADLNAHNEIWNKHAHSDDKGAQLAKAIMDAEGGFLNDAELATRQDPAFGGFSSPDVTIVHNGIHHHCDWTPLDSLSSNHRPILTTLHLPSQQRKGPKRLVWNW